MKRGDESESQMRICHVEISWISGSLKSRERDIVRDNGARELAALRRIRSELKERRDISGNIVARREGGQEQRDGGG